MRRVSLVLAAAAFGVGALASSASADIYTVCVGERCVCLSEPGTTCYTPPQGDKCIAVDIDRDGDAERVYCPRV